MHTRYPHEIVKGNEETFERMQKEGKRIMSLTESEHATVKDKSPVERGNWLRKNRNRNKACPCGSGIKFKKCCWWGTR